ncbi:MAG: transglutaminase domain-containing protein [Gemmataceae bacterium]|nr:transglutaminase domain-containing protein [Gemmataceae bacterium]
MKRQISFLACSLLGFLAAASVAGAADKRSFAVKHELGINVPKGAKQVRIWFAIPQDTKAQMTEEFTVVSPSKGFEKVQDSEGNQFLFLDVKEPKADKLNVLTTFTLTRSEVNAPADASKSRPLTPAERLKLAAYLKANKHVVINDEIRQLARKIVGEEDNPVRAARKIYDWVLDNIEYWVKEPSKLRASKVGSTTHCLTTGTGNCTDFHSLFASLARAAGIPTQIVYGSLFKPELDGKNIDQSYHCWIEFYAPNIGWIPLDVAVADIFAGKIRLNETNKTLVSRTTATGYDGPNPKMVDYYFGNLEARRVTWSRGRDLILTPPQKGAPVNAIPVAYIEVDGEELSSANWTRLLTFRELKKP